MPMLLLCSYHGMYIYTHIAPWMVSAHPSHDAMRCQGGCRAEACPGARRERSCRKKPQDACSSVWRSGHAAIHVLRITHAPHWATVRAKRHFAGFLFFGFRFLSGLLALARGVCLCVFSFSARQRRRRRGKLQRVGSEVCVGIHRTPSGIGPLRRS